MDDDKMAKWFDYDNWWQDQIYDVMLDENFS